MNWRCPKYLRASRDQTCKLLVPGVCCGDRATVVAAHANSSRFGKGASIKAHDWAVADACHTCHVWLDQGPAPRERKERIWFAGWVRTLASRVKRGILKSQIDLTNPTPELVGDAFARGLITL